jgi:rhodanese-related sulfurtransferase
MASIPNGNAQRFIIGVRQSMAIIFIALLLGILSYSFYPFGPLPWSTSNTNQDNKKINPKINKITVQDAWAFYQRKQALFLDARDPLSFRGGHIPGAMNVPPKEVEASLSIIRAKEKEGLRIIAYCDGEACPLAAELAETLRKKGIDSVYVFVNGWPLWRENGYPLEKEVNP